MKMLFESRFEWTLDDTKAIYYRSMLKSTRYRMAFIFLALSVACLVTLLVLFSESPIISIAVGMFIIIIACSAVIAYFKHQRLVSDEYAQLVKGFGGKAPQLTIQVSDEALTSKNRDGKGGGVCFDDILYVSEDKQRFILAARTREIYVLKKDFFTKGTPEEFKAFLKKKGIRLK